MHPMYPLPTFGITSPLTCFVNLPSPPFPVLPPSQAALIPP